MIKAINYIILCFCIISCNHNKVQDKTAITKDIIADSTINVINNNDENLIKISLDKYFPEYTLVNYSQINLNFDSILDYVAVIEDSCVSDVINKDITCYRKIVLITNATPEKYDVAILNMDLFEPSFTNNNANIFYEPNIEFSIKDEYFSVEESIKDILNIITFKYDKRLKKWLLYKIDESTYDNAQPKLDKDGAIIFKNKIKSQKDFGFVVFNKL